MTPRRVLRIGALGAIGLVIAAGCGSRSSRPSATQQTGNPATPRGGSGSQAVPPTQCDPNVSVSGPADCAFAENTFYEYWLHQGVASFSVYSPTAQNYATVECSTSADIVCTTDRGASVRFSVEAVEAYTHAQAEQYADAHKVIGTLLDASEYVAMVEDAVKAALPKSGLVANNEQIGKSLVKCRAGAPDRLTCVAAAQAVPSGDYYWITLGLAFDRKSGVVTVTSESSPGYLSAAAAAPALNPAPTTPVPTGRGYVFYGFGGTFLNDDDSDSTCYPYCDESGPLDYSYEP